MRNSCALRPVILVFVFALVQASAIADSNLVLSKTTLPAGQTTTIAGGSLSYRVIVRNDGPDPAINVRIVDELFDIFQMSLPSPGSTCTEDPLGVGFGRRVTCTWAGETAVGQERTIDFEVRTCGGTPCNNMLVADKASASTDSVDPNLANNSQVGVGGGSVPAVITEVLTQTTFETTVQANRETVSPSQQVIYTIVVNNQGPSSTADTTVAHRLPPGWTVDSISTGSGFPASCSGVGSRTGRCTFALQSPFICAAFAPGEETVTVVANVPASEIPAIRLVQTSVTSTNCLPDLGTTESTTETRVLGPVFLQFPQFGGGAGFTSDIVLTNPSPTDPVDGIVLFYDENGLPLSIELEGGVGPVETIPFSIESWGGLRLSTLSTGPLALGSATVNVSGLAGGVVRFAIPGIGIAGVGAAPPLRRAIAPVSQRNGIRTGLSIRNLSAGNNLVALSLRTLDGVEVTGGIGAVALSANGRSARFADELFPGADLEDFEGVVVIESLEVVSVIALELGDNPGEFTTLPVTEIGLVMPILEDSPGEDR